MSFRTLPCRAEDGLGRAYAVGAEVFRFTAASLRGLGFFSLADLTIHPILLPRFYLATVRNPSETSVFAAAS